MKKYRMPLLVVAIAIAILAVPVVASANHQWSNYQWKSKAPVSLTLGDNVGPDWDVQLGDAIADWNASTVLSLTEVTGAANNTVDCIPASGKIEVCNSDYGDNGWLGIASVWIAQRNKITRANARMNDYYFDSIESPTEASAWRRMVMCQEIGHDFGLDHQDEIFTNANLGTCMDYTNNPLGPPSNVAPNDHDYDQLVSIYGAKSKGGGGKGGGGGHGGGPPPGKGKPNFAPLSGGNSEWGRAIGYEGNGRANKFELDFGNGNSVITHVLWAS